MLMLPTPTPLPFLALPLLSQPGFYFLSFCFPVSFIRALYRSVGESLFPDTCSYTTEDYVSTQ